jgi:FAD:protein FMN transferase
MRMMGMVREERGGGCGWWPWWALVCWMLAAGGVGWGEEVDGVFGAVVGEGEVDGDGAAGWGRWSFEAGAMGTRLRLVIYGAEGEADAVADAAEAAFAVAREVELACSDYDAGSELMRLMGRGAGEWHEVGEVLFGVLAEAREIAEKTGGAFDPALGNLTRLWRRARSRGELPGAEELAAARAASGWDKLELEERGRLVRWEVEGLRLDLGGIGKGYAADLMWEELEARGFGIASVEVGGDVRVGPAPPGARGWPVRVKVGVQERLYLVAEGAVSSSGDQHQWVEVDGRRFSHIIDPGTGLGLREARSATAFARRATWSDALATAACVGDAGGFGWEGLEVEEGEGGQVWVRLALLAEKRKG